MSDPGSGQIDSLDPLDRIVEALVDQSTPEGPDSAVRERLLADIERLNDAPPHATTSSPRREAIKGRLVRYAAIAATIVAVAFLVGEISLRTSRGPGAAFAAMIQRVQQARTATFTLVMEMDGVPTVEIENMFMEPAWHYQHVKHGDAEFIQVMNLEQGKSLSLYVPEKKAQLLEFTGYPEDPEQQNFIDEFRRMTEEGAVFEGRETVGGVEALKYRYDKAGDHYVIWLNEASTLPVKLVARDVGEGDESHATMTMTDFQWDEAVDESLFSLEIPKGYELATDTALDAGDWSSDNFVAMMRFVCRLNDGQFPDELNAMSLVSLLTQQLRASADAGLPKQQREQRALERLADAFDRPELANMTTQQRMQFALTDLAPMLGGGVGFMESTKQTHQWHYEGRGVALGDGVAVVLWWSPKQQSPEDANSEAESDASDDVLDPNVAHVMYGDLRIEKMPVDEVPRVD